MSYGSTAAMDAVYMLGCAVAMRRPRPCSANARPPRRPCIGAWFSFAYSRLDAILRCRLARQPELPGLRRQIAAEALVSLLRKTPKTARLVNAPRRKQLALGPQNDLSITRLAGESDALIDQPSAQTQTARVRLDQQQTKLGDSWRLAHQKDAAQDLTASLGDPAAFALDIECLHEMRRNFGDQRLEMLVITILFGVEHAVAMRHPANVARPKRAQRVRRRFWFCRPGSQRLLDRRHRRGEPRTFEIRQRRKHCRHLLTRTELERHKGLPPARRQRQNLLAAIIGRRLAHDQPLLFEAAQQAAQVTLIEPEPCRQAAGGRRWRRCLTVRPVAPMRELVEDAHFRQRIRAVQQPLLQHADLLRIKPVETTDVGNAPFSIAGLRLDHGAG